MFAEVRMDYEGIGLLMFHYQVIINSGQVVCEHQQSVWSKQLLICLKALIQQGRLSVQVQMMFRTSKSARLWLITSLYSFQISHNLKLVKLIFRFKSQNKCKLRVLDSFQTSALCLIFVQNQFQIQFCEAYMVFLSFKKNFEV